MKGCQMKGISVSSTVLMQLVTDLHLHTLPNPRMSSPMSPALLAGGWGGAGFFLWSSWLGLSLSHVQFTVQHFSNLCINLISFIKLQIPKRQVHLCSFHSVQLSAFCMQNTVKKFWPRKLLRWTAQSTFKICCNLHDKMIVRFFSYFPLNNHPGISSVWFL